MVFADRSVTMKLFQQNSTGFGHTRLPSNHKCFPANYSLVLEPQNLFTSNDLQYAVAIALQIGN